MKFLKSWKIMISGKAARNIQIGKLNNYKINYKPSKMMKGQKNIIKQMK